MVGLYLIIWICRHLAKRSWHSSRRGRSSKKSLRRLHQSEGVQGAGKQPLARVQQLIRVLLPEKLNIDENLLERMPKLTHGKFVQMIRVLRRPAAHCAIR